MFLYERSRIIAYSVSYLAGYGHKTPNERISRMDDVRVHGVFIYSFHSQLFHYERNLIFRTVAREAFAIGPHLHAPFLEPFLHPPPLSAQENHPPTLCSRLGNAGEFEYIGEPGETTKISTLGSTNFVNRYFLVWGNLEIDVNTTFDNCALSMDPEILITTSGTVSLTIQHSYFFSCVDMWQGIRLNPGATAIVTDSEFEDAQVCFEVRSYAPHQFTGNILNRNRVGMQLFTPFTPAAFNDNTFTCTSELSPPWQDRITRAGIEVHNTLAYLSSHGLAINTLSEMQCGVWAIRSFVYLEGAHFAEMRAGDDDFGDIAGVGTSGSGIIASGGSCLINPNADHFDLATACQFRSNEAHGVVANGANLDIRNCLFSRNVTGVDTRNNFDAENIDIQFCEFLDLGALVDNTTSPLPARGIHMHRSNGNPGTDQDDLIAHNRFITTNGNTGSGAIMGIHLHGGVSGNFCTVDSNFYENNANRKGTFALLYPEESNFLRIIRNDLVYHETFNNLTRYGIECYDGTGSEHNFSFNNINGDAGTDAHTYLCAFHIVLTPNIRVCANNTTFGHRGFHFLGNCNPMRFIENDMGAHTHGLLVNPSGEIGEQLRTQNMWHGPFTNMAALNDNLLNYQASLFTVHSMDPAFFPPTNLREPDEWFVPIMGNTAICSNVVEEVQLDAFDLQVVDNTYAPANPAAEWDAQRRVYYKLLHYPTLAAQPEVAAFYNQLNSSSSGKYAQADFALFQATLIDAGAQQDLGIVRENIANKQAAIAAIDVQLAAGFSAALWAQKQTLVNEIVDLLEGEESIAEQATTERESALDALNATLSTLPQNTAWEQARADYLGWVIKKRKGLALSATELDGVRLLSQEDPEALGATVFATRTLLPPEDLLWNSFDDPSCREGAGEPRHEHSQAAKASDAAFVISPNPVNEHLVIRFAKPTSGILTVLDALGRPVNVLHVQESKDVFYPSSSLPPGMYTCLLQTDEEIAQQRRFVVAR